VPSEHDSLKIKFFTGLSLSALSYNRNDRQEWSIFRSLPSLKLTNKSPSTRSKCNDCQVYLRNSQWHNEILFLSIDVDKFLCVRCIDKKIITVKQLDNFVKKQHNGIIPPIPIKQISKKNQIRIAKGHKI
jgi:hypothetical protein